MTCCHKSFTRRKKEIKEGGNKREEENEAILANWVQIRMGKIVKTIKIYHKNFPFFV